MSTRGKPIPTAGDAHRQAQAAEAARQEAARQAEQARNAAALRHANVHATR